jgi:hypothetical protein
MLATNLLRVSVLAGIVGFLLGIVMGIREDFVLVPAHAHLNLLGYVGLFLAALYYSAVPAAAASRLAVIHAWLAVAGAIVLPAGIAAVLLGGTGYIALPIIGSLLAVVALLLFATIVFRYGLPQRA